MTSQTAHAAAPAQVPTIAPAIGVALIAGRIGNARRITGQNGTSWLTLVTMAAPDEFTSPSTVELRSKGKLGERDEVWRGKVRITGFRRSYKTTDQQTGEQLTVQTADTRLDVISE
jgi:hypothetical protein